MADPYHKHGSKGTQLPSSSRNYADPITPPKSAIDLPTPPTSHIELSTNPLSRHVHSEAQRRSTDQETESNTKVGGETNDPSSIYDQSPSVNANTRKVQRSSLGEPTPRATKGDQHPPSSFESPAKRGRSTERGAPVDSNISRSRTPSPILGSMTASNGHVSFGAALQPSPEEVRMLLYGENEEDEERPADISKKEMDSLLERLDSMGLANAELKVESSRETELASMVKKLVQHAQSQDQYLDSLEVSLHNTRIRSISTLSSLRTSFAHSFAAEFELRARLEAELDGVRAQAMKLSSMLAKSEARNEEADKERAMSAEEEIVWQEEMKDHANAYARQQAARARAAQFSQTQSKTAEGQQESTSPLVDHEPKAESATTLQEPFEEHNTSSHIGADGITRSSSDGNVTGLGISSVGAGVERNTSASSPLSTIIKERNKLISDKRYLKLRVRDAEAQRDRLELELKGLRPLLVRGAASKKEAAAQLASTPSTVAPTTPGRTHKRDRSRRRRQAMMGDAEAEHLLLAARRLNGRSKEDGRPHTPPQASGSYNPRTPKTPRTAQTPRSAYAPESAPPTASSSIAQESALLDPQGSPLAARTTNLARWGSHQRVDSGRSTGGIDDLLQAAQTVLSPGARHRQSHSRAQNVQESDQEDDLSEGHDKGAPNIFDESPKRRRVSSAIVESSGRPLENLPLSPDKSIFSSSRRLRTSTEGAEPISSSQDHSAPSAPIASQSSALSALDLLADQAAASQQPSQSSEPSGSGEGEAYAGGHTDDSDDGMVMDQEGSTSHPGGHYYPRGSYGHSYAHPSLSSTMNADTYRLASQPGYTYGSTHSPSSLSSQGWTSQSIPASRNGLYSPPSHPRFALQSGPRLTSGHVTSMGHPIAVPAQPAKNSASSQSDEGNTSNRTPQKGGNTSPDKRLPYVRWSEEEDTKLRAAIEEYGQRWELVARSVGTRSYHQCRQRYLLMRRKEAAARENGSDNRQNGQHAATAAAAS